MSTVPEPTPLDPHILNLALGLKATDRAGWKRIGLTQPESVAAHSWGVAWLALVLTPRSLDRDRVLALALLHDLPEVVVGDITPHDGISPQDKSDAERTVAARMLGARPDLWGLWEDYEKDRSPEAGFVHELDKLDMALQALRYGGWHSDSVDLQPPNTREFIDSARRQLHSPALLSVLDQAEAAATAAAAAAAQPGGQPS